MTLGQSLNKYRAILSDCTESLRAEREDIKTWRNNGRDLSPILQTITRLEDKIEIYKGIIADLESLKQESN